jgi:hypothetical protein
MFRTAAALGLGLTAAALALSPDYAAPAPGTPTPITQVLGAQPLYREIKDWVIACDNTRSCFAKFAPAQEGDGDGGFLSLTRDAGPSAGVSVSLEDVEGQNPPDARSLRLDGRPVGVGLAWRLNPKEQAATLEGAGAAAFVRAISNGTRLTYGGNASPSIVSLSGLKAALLVMDEAQGRLDTVTALARTGPRPATAVPAPIALPAIHAAPPQPPLPDAASFAARVRRSQGALLKAHDCRPKMSRADEAHPLDRAKVLVLLGCLAAAYQETSLTLIAPRDGPEQARLLVLPLEPTATENEPLPGEYIIDGWDAASSTLSQSAKGRGPADCGSSTSWTYDGQRFLVTRYNALPRCGGGPPGDWPTIYRVRVVAGG